MRCIFCKNDSKGSKSREHIIPESLGNKRTVLEPGVVCDVCNNYFAIKIEGPLLESDLFKQLRFAHGIYSKKGRLPSGKGVVAGTQVELIAGKGSRVLEVICNDGSVFKKVKDGEVNKMYVGMGINFPERDKLLSRFLGKVAIEMLADRFYGHDGWNEEIVDKNELDLLRNYVRYDSGINFWEYNIRTIYPPSQKFMKPGSGRKVYEVLHEGDFVYTLDMELFLVQAIMGVEFALNLTNPSIRGYEKVLKDSGGVSILDIKDDRIRLPVDP